MRLTPCYNPKSVYNKYIGEYVVARCGKCPACLDARSASWVTRLDMEKSAHKYCFFVTLQYDEQHVNQLVRIDKSDYPEGAFDFDFYYLDSQTGEYVNLYYDGAEVTQRDVDFCKDTPVLLVPSVSDYQLFIKRLRYYCSKYDERIRYFNTFEYGPTTFRPHCHSLFFFNSSLLAQDFEQLLGASWTFGRVFDPHPVEGSAASYVASYVNSFSSLPSIYRYKSLRQKSTFSKCPPIGCLQFGREELRKYFFDPQFSFSVFDSHSKTFHDVAYPTAFTNRLFYFCPRFGLLSSYEQYLVYSLVYEFPYIDDFFCYYINLTKFYQSFLKTKFRFGFRHDYFTMVFYDESGSFIEDGFYKFVLGLLKVARLMREFNITLTEYLYYLNLYVSKKSAHVLAEWYDLQSVYFETHPISDFLLFHPLFCKSVNGKKFSDLSASQRHYLLTYGYTFGEDDVVSLDFRKTESYHDLKSMHDVIYHRNTKSKYNNDYLLANKDKFSNVLNYYNSL